MCRYAGLFVALILASIVLAAGAGAQAPEGKSAPPSEAAAKTPEGKSAVPEEAGAQTPEGQPAVSREAAAGEQAAPEASGAQAPERQPAAPQDITPRQLIEAARTALSRKALDDAEFLLSGVERTDETADDLDFLYGSIASARGDWETAIARFQAMLARDPELTRVRLDLALAYFRAQQDGNAAYHFRLALGAKDLPEVVRARAQAFLDIIWRRKSWWITGWLAAAPDSNINAATSSRAVSLWGLPAQLSEDARRTSGVGLSVNVSGGYEGELGEGMRFRVAAGLNTRTYRKDEFNEQIVSLRAGPRLLFRRFDLRPELTHKIRVLGDDTYSRATGFELSGGWMIDQRRQLNATLGAEWVNYETFLGDGRRDKVQLGYSRALDRATLLQVDSIFRREDLKSDANSWREFVIGFTAKRELPVGFVVTAGPSYRWRRYGAPQRIFGPNSRRDRTLEGHIAVSNRYFQLFGFMPEVTLRHERRNSNVKLHDYTRTVAEIGMVRTF